MGSKKKNVSAKPPSPTTPEERQLWDDIVRSCIAQGEHGQEAVARANAVLAGRQRAMGSGCEGLEP